MHPKAVPQVTVIQVPVCLHSPAHTGHSLGLLSASTQLADDSPLDNEYAESASASEVPMATLFHYHALGHSQAESKGQLTLQAQRCHLTVTMCLTHRAGTMLTSWTLTHLTHTSPLHTAQCTGMYLVFIHLCSKILISFHYFSIR